jgi:hypothetical protein
VADRKELWKVEEGVPNHLPILDLFIEEFFAKARPLEGFGALLVQHQMGTIVPMAKGLFALGLRPQNTWWVDIPYSSNIHVRNHLVRAGIARARFIPQTYSLGQPYGLGQVARVAAGIRLVDKSLPPTTPLLILDDGAYALQALAGRMARVARPIRMVEQTTRGVMHVRENEEVSNFAASVPVVNVAESPPKRLLEGPCIGRSVLEGLNRKLNGAFFEPSKSRVLILGLGTVGLTVARALVRVASFPPSSIWAADDTPEARTSAGKLGLRLCSRLPESGQLEGNRFDMVIGCSGHSSFTPQDAHVLANNAMLVSASSGNEELSLDSFLTKADTIDVIPQLPFKTPGSPHDDVVLKLEKKTLKFFNSGFPINFDGRVNSVPTKYMQATRICMVAGAVQAATAEEAGLQPLSQLYSEWVLKHCPSSHHFLE